MRLARVFRQRISIVNVLTFGFGALIIATVSGALLVSLLSGGRNTEDLIRDKTILIVKAVVERVRQHLEPARSQTEFLASLVAADALDPGDQKSLIAHLTTASAAAPQILAITYLDKNLQAIRMPRNNTNPVPLIGDMSNTLYAVTGMATLRQSEESYWGVPVYINGIDATMVNVSTPVRRDGEFIGAFVASVLINELSRYLRDYQSDHDEVPFILFGADEVLAHPSLADGVAGLSDQTPLPLLSRINDPVLRALWNPQKTEPVPGVRNPGFEALFVRTAQNRYAVVYQYLQRYGGIPWIVGIHFSAADFADEFFDRLKYAAYAGLVMLLLAVVAVFSIARHISKPVQQLAETAIQVRQYGPQQLAPLPKSRLFELNTANRAFNEMAEGLRERELLRETFGKYVPASIADAILEDRGILQPHTRVATILFTDIVGFSTISEAMTPECLINMLNDYFSVLIDIVEKYGGVIHQFQGDAILATYNLPIKDPRHAEKAVRTALAIQQALAHRTFGDGIVLATRIGINTGTIVGGTVGAGSRLGFTVHGDDVNLAARIEQMNKQYGTSILVAQSTVDLAGAAFPFELVGELPVRGRQQPVVLYWIPQSTDGVATTGLSVGIV